MIELLRSTLRLLWGLYALATFGLVTLTVTLLVAVVPGLKARRRLARWGARTIFAVTGIGLRVRTVQNLPSGACVVVANHASYLDGVILTAALPANFSFVIKREMTGVPLAHLLLRRLGSEFVERSDRHRSARDARRIRGKAEGGHPLAFFPEGTFVAEPGLGRFRNGAFAAAARAGLPVVPVVIRGARHILPAEQWLPRLGPIEVTVTEPIHLAGSSTGHTARALLTASRARILQGLGEPDLLAGPGAGTG
ncbi:MAG: lysophospholipid acyltransferase family protein [Gammaproteobacteria bacterium]|jgi:1-acyl-sn-glycerol-3-phosphate acyltransferase